MTNEGMIAMKFQRRLQNTISTLSKKVEETNLIKEESH